MRRRRYRNDAVIWILNWMKINWISTKFRFFSFSFYFRCEKEISSYRIKSYRANDQWIRCTNIIYEELTIAYLHLRRIFLCRGINTLKNHVANWPLRTKQCELAKGRLFLQLVQRVDRRRPHCCFRSTQSNWISINWTQNNRFFLFTLVESEIVNIFITWSMRAILEWNIEHSQI